jgi:hypothetical protein
MKKTPNINYLLQIVEQMLNGQIDTVCFKLDFEYELTKRYRAMAKEDKECAELIYDYLYEDGLCKAENLPASKFLAVIKRQYKEVQDIINGGFC